MTEESRRSEGGEAAEPRPDRPGDPGDEAVPAVVAASAAALAPPVSSPSPSSTVGSVARDETESAPRSAAPERPAPARAAGDRGRTIAFATLAGLVLLGGLLILRGPQATAPAGAPSASASASASAGSVASGAVADPSAPSSSSASSASTASDASSSASASAEAAPRFVPVWRAASLEKDPAVEILHGTLGKHTLAGALAQAGLAKAEIRRVTRAVEGVRRLERGASKDAFVVARDRAEGAVLAFEYVTSPTDVWQARGEDASSGGALTANKLELFVEKRRAQASLVVTSDLAKAIAAAGLREDALHEIDDALDGHGDSAIIKPGVRLRVVGSEDWVEGAFARFHVDALEYIPRSGANLRVYFYERDASVEGSRRRTPHPGFYDAKGQQPFRGTFRSPLPTARITSRFNPKRMHPVLHVVMPHNGIDFGASTGTPVFASAPGTVHSAGDGGPCGNMIQIEHSNGLTTAYCHLSRFAAGLHAGQHVEARQLVGYVGQTGRATGPHLHFAVKRGGNFIDPMALKMDGVRTLPPADREAFAKRRAELDPAIDALALPSADGVAADEKEEKDEPAGEE